MSSESPKLPELGRDPRYSPQEHENNETSENSEKVFPI